MIKIVTFSKPFDRRHTDPKKNYGVGGVACRMILKGDAGAIQFGFYTGIYLPHVLREWREKKKPYYPEPQGFDVGYHSHKQQYPEQTQMDCDLLGGKCYYDGSGLRADKWFKIFLEEGDNVIWDLLEKEYVSMFGEEKQPENGD